MNQFCASRHGLSIYMMHKRLHVHAEVQMRCSAARPGRAWHLIEVMRVLHAIANLYFSRTGVMLMRCNCSWATQGKRQLQARGWC